MNRPRKGLTTPAIPQRFTSLSSSRWIDLARLTVVILCLTLVSAPLQAVEPDEVLDDPVLEGRARELSKEIRCLVCQNESIDSSNAQLAKDLRVIVRERLVAGDSDQEVYDYLVARYGDFVLLRPPMRPETYFLWYGPAVVLLLGAAGVGFYFMRLKQRAASEAPSPLSDQEQEQLARLLAGTEQQGSGADVSGQSQPGRPRGADQ